MSLARRSARTGLVLLGERYAEPAGQLLGYVVLEAEVRRGRGYVLAYERVLIARHAVREVVAGGVARVLAVHPVEILVPVHLAAVYAHDDGVRGKFRVGRVPVVFGRFRLGLLLLRGAAAGEGGYEKQGGKQQDKRFFHQLSPFLSESFSVPFQPATKAEASSRTRARFLRRMAMTGFAAASTLSRPFQALCA